MTAPCRRISWLYGPFCDVACRPRRRRSHGRNRSLTCRDQARWPTRGQVEHVGLEFLRGQHPRNVATPSPNGGQRRTRPVQGVASTRRKGTPTVPRLVAARPRTREFNSWQCATVAPNTRHRPDSKMQRSRVLGTRQASQYCVFARSSNTALVGPVKLPQLGEGAKAVSGQRFPIAVWPVARSTASYRPPALAAS